MPVTDYDDHLLGIVTVDDIIDVIDDEAASDYSGLAGVNVEEINENPVKSASATLPLVDHFIILGMSTASLISHYEELVSEASILAGLYFFDHRDGWKRRYTIVSGRCTSPSDFR